MPIAIHCPFYCILHKLYQQENLMPFNFFIKYLMLFIFYFLFENLLLKFIKFLIKFFPYQSLITIEQIHILLYKFFIFSEFQIFSTYFFHYPHKKSYPYLSRFDKSYNLFQ